MSWRKNLFAVTAATFIGFTGFTLVMPFLPLYFQQLGVTDVGELALWSGLSLGVTPAITALMSPLWGRLADRVGRKIMIERSLVSFVIVMAAMGFVTEAWHVFALRAVQGLFAGYGALALTMAADAAPKDKMAFAIGTVQTAQRIGPALGPVIGGDGRAARRPAAGVPGDRRLLSRRARARVHHVSRASRAHVPSDAKREGRITFRNVLALENFVLLIAVVFGLQFVDRSFGPVLPLYVAELGTPMDAVPILSGVLFSISAGAGAIGNHLARGLLARTSARTVIAGVGRVAALGTLTYVFAAGTGLLMIGTSVFGLAIGAASTAAYTAAGAVIPAGSARRGIWFADDRLAHRSGDEPDHLRPARHAQPASSLRPRHVRAPVRRGPRAASDGRSRRRRRRRRQHRRRRSLA